VPACLHETLRDAGVSAGVAVPAVRSDVDSEFMRGLIDGMRCGVLSIDVEGRLVMLNDHARRILGLVEIPPPGTALGRALPHCPQVVRALAESFSMSSLPNRAEITLADGADGAKSIGFTLSLVQGADGRPAGAAMFFKDLTPIEHKAEQERLKDRLAVLGQMAASMAHEIRNPLASIEVNCKLLSRKLVGDRGCCDLLGKVTAEIQRLNRSVDSCLQYVRPVALSLGHHELIPLLEEAIRVAEGRRGKPGIEIRRQFAAGIAPFLLDQALLHQVFVNVLLNALEAVGDAGRVTVEARCIEGSGAASIPYQPADVVGDPWVDARRFAIVRISDTGPGIPPADRERIFDPFFTTKEHGSGVGLAVAKKLVGSHRGMIAVSGPPSGGAVIVVRLPMVERANEGRIG